MVRRGEHVTRPSLNVVTAPIAEEASPLPSRRHHDDTPAVRLQPAEYSMAEKAFGKLGHALVYCSLFPVAVRATTEQRTPSPIDNE